MNERLDLKNVNRDEYLLDPARKQSYVNTAFAIVSSSYDRFTRYSSFGMDQAWKRDLVQQVKSKLEPGHDIVDLATGTGDLAFAFAPLVPEGKVIGIDLTESMIDLAEKNRIQCQVQNVEFRVGDLMATELPSGSVDVVSVSYGLRNCPDYRLGLAEIHRILKPGGYLASIDFARLENPIAKYLFHKSLLVTCHFYGWLWHGEPAAYAYLAHSIQHYATNREFNDALNKAGFEIIAQRSKLMGVIYLHLARKAAT